MMLVVQPQNYYKAATMVFGFMFRSQSLAFYAALFMIGGCADTELGVVLPPKGAFYFPTAIAPLPSSITGIGQDMALVSNANFDRRFGSGWLSLVSVASLLNAQKPADAVIKQLNIPAIGGPIALDTTQSLSDNGRILAFIGHRGSYLISIIEITKVNDELNISCGNPDAVEGLDSNERHTDCDRQHLYALDDETNIAKFNEEMNKDNFIDPYALATYVDHNSGQSKLAVSFVSHLSESLNRLLIFNINNQANETDAFLIPEHAIILGEAGVGSLAIRPPVAGCNLSEPGCDTYIAASSRFYSTYSEYASIFAVTIAPDGTVRRTIHDLAAEIGGYDAGGIIFSPDGSHAYVATNSQDNLIALDTSLTSRAIIDDYSYSYVLEPNYTITQVLPLMGTPTNLINFTGNNPLGSTNEEIEYIALTSFTANQIDIIATIRGALISVAQIHGSQTAENYIGLRPLALANISTNNEILLLVGTLYDHGVTTIRIPRDNVAFASVINRVRTTEFGEVSTK
ncbi:MAG: hypothetical protein JW841_16765 [Deltaproteobacteria bacterium]|nr:hypothetical protein [Deltaproteobacteria bacterium]